MVSDTGYLLGAAGAVVASAAFLVVTALNTPDVAAPSGTASSAADQSSATTGAASPGSGSGTASLQPVRAEPSVAAPAGSSRAAAPVASVERQPALPDDRLKAEALRAAATRTGHSNPSVGESPRRAPDSPVQSVETKNSEAKSLAVTPAGTVHLPGSATAPQDSPRKVVSTSVPVQPGAGIATTPLHSEPRALAIPTVAPRSVPVTVFRSASASERPATVGGETMRAKPSGSAASKSTEARKRTKSSKTKASKRTRKAANPAPIQPAASAPQPPVIGFDLIGWLRR